MWGFFEIIFIVLFRLKSWAQTRLKEDGAFSAASCHVQKHKGTSPWKIIMGSINSTTNLTFFSKTKNIVIN